MGTSETTIAELEKQAALAEQKAAKARAAAEEATLAELARQRDRAEAFDRAWLEGAPARLHELEAEAEEAVARLTTALAESEIGAALIAIRKAQRLQFDLGSRITGLRAR